MNLLLAVKSCNQQRYAGYNRAIRQTWGRHVELPNQLRFFHGFPQSTEDDVLWDRRDERFLTCPDDYDSLPNKTREILKWFLNSEEFSHVFLCDTDTFVHVPTLMTSGFDKYDYSGRFGTRPKVGVPFRHTDDRKNHFDVCWAWASGGVGYFLNRKAAEIVVETPFEHWAEDFTVGQILGPRIRNCEITASDLPEFETFASWHFQRRQYNNQVYDLKFGWMEKMYKEHYGDRQS